MINPFVLPSPICRKADLKRVRALLRNDSDFVITGVPGIGRRTLIRDAAKQAGVRYLEIDCLRCRNASQFIRLLADSVCAAFSAPSELAHIHQWSQEQPLALDQSLPYQARLVWPPAPGKEWPLFECLLALPQHLAETLNCRVVIVFHNFPHIRAWDRHRKWESYLLQEILRQNQVSYAVVATVAEAWMEVDQIPIIFLSPLSDGDLRPWIISSMATAGFSFDAEGHSLELFLSYAQGHVKDAIALAQRIWWECNMAATLALSGVGMIEAHQVHSSMLSLVQDISVTFEALLLLLPPTQAKLIESLALDPTDSPQSNAYIKKHHLSRGGSLQGALSSLEQKGLIYGPQFNYRVALPLFDFWLKQRLRSGTTFDTNC